MLVIRESNHEDLGDKKQLFEQLKHAAQGCHPVTFEYSKAEGAKMVDALPYSSVLQGGIWYLAALNADKLKSYALSKIDRLLVASDTFTPDAEIVEKLRAEDSIWLNLKKSEVVLSVAPPAADYFAPKTHWRTKNRQAARRRRPDRLGHHRPPQPDPCPSCGSGFRASTSSSPASLQAELNQQLYAYLCEPS